MSITNNNPSENFDHLEWDSDFFNLKTGVITDPLLSVDQLSDVLNDLRDREYGLVYWPSDRSFKMPNGLKKEFNALLVDEKVEFLQNLTSVDSNYQTPAGVFDDLEGVNKEKLYELALIAGEHSRFKIDSLTQRYWADMYRLWTDKSLVLDLPSKLFYWGEKNDPQGFVVLHVNGDVARISLVAVSYKIQGNGVGGKLIDMSLDYAKSLNCKRIYVCTQFNNKPAMKFYEHCGFEVERIDNYYHFHPRKK